MVIVDTDIIIKALKKDTETLKEVSDLLENKSAAITPVQVTEVYAYAQSEELPLIGSFFDLFEICDFNREVAELAGEFMQHYKNYHDSLTIVDCMVAAAAVIGEYEVYTNHPQHFPMTEIKLYHKTIEAIRVRSKERLVNID